MSSVRLINDDAAFFSQFSLDYVIVTGSLRGDVYPNDVIRKFIRSGLCSREPGSRRGLTYCQPSKASRYSIAQN